ncbi:MAG: hypothetical protein ABFD98_05145 [Syntrophobacteraceae bacterium]|nr:hypothetical protein [Desulfobacteraceae bacterium]
MNTTDAGEQSPMEYTLSHFEEIARQNRFPENNVIAHDASRCLVCHPERAAAGAFALYLEVVARSVLIRRPRLDSPLVDTINDDLSLSGETRQVSLESCAAGEKQALLAWEDWTRNALATGLGLLSIHSGTSLEFELDEEEEAGNGALVREKSAWIMAAQRKAAGLR